MLALDSACQPDPAKRRKNKSKKITILFRVPGCPADNLTYVADDAQGPRTKPSSSETELYGILLTRFHTFAAGGAVGSDFCLFVNKLGDGWAGAGLDTFLTLGTL